jgi:hypothetical protein
MGHVASKVSGVIGVIKPLRKVKVQHTRLPYPVRVGCPPLDRSALKHSVLVTSPAVIKTVARIDSTVRSVGRRPFKPPTGITPTPTLPAQPPQNSKSLVRLLGFLAAASAVIVAASSRLQTSAEESFKKADELVTLISVVRKANETKGMPKDDVESALAKFGNSSSAPLDGSQTTSMPARHVIATIRDRVGCWDKMASWSQRRASGANFSPGHRERGC